MPRIRINFTLSGSYDLDVSAPVLRRLRKIDDTLDEEQLTHVLGAEPDTYEMLNHITET